MPVSMLGIYSPALSLLTGYQARESSPCCWRWHPRLPQRPDSSKAASPECPARPLLAPWRGFTGPAIPRPTPRAPKPTAARYSIRPCPASSKARSNSQGIPAQAQQGRGNKRGNKPRVSAHAHREPRIQDSRPKGSQPRQQGQQVSSTQPARRLQRQQAPP